jgi:hypothetical protein
MTRKQDNDPALWLRPWCCLKEAAFFAEKAANTTCLPQTIFRSPRDDGINWRNAAAACPMFDRRTDFIFHATMLPANYFNA